MTADPAPHLRKARDLLQRSAILLGVNLFEDAGRCAYLAAFHAAQAPIVRRTGRLAKTHHGVRVEFARLSRAEAALEQTFVTFLAQSYELKSLADYDTGEIAQVSLASASAAIAGAERFLAAIETLLNDPAPDAP